MSAPSLPPRVVCVVVDGYNFADNTCWIERAYPELLEFIRKELASRIPSGQDIVIAKDGLHLFTPDGAKLHRGGQLSMQKMYQQNMLMSKLRHGELGPTPGEPGYKWTIHESLLKPDLKANRLVASGEDINYAMTVNALSEKEALKPIGADPRNATATDIFLVTSDADHIATLDGGPSGVLRWCVISNPCKPLQRWGEQSHRCLVFKLQGVTQDPSTSSSSSAAAGGGGAQGAPGERAAAGTVASSSSSSSSSSAGPPNSTRDQQSGSTGAGDATTSERQPHHQSSRPSGTRGFGGRGGGGGACFKCGKEGHWSRECPMNNEYGGEYSGGDDIHPPNHSHHDQRGYSNSGRHHQRQGQQEQQQQMQQQQQLPGRPHRYNVMEVDDDSDDDEFQLRRAPPQPSQRLAPSVRQQQYNHDGNNPQQQEQEQRRPQKQQRSFVVQDFHKKEEEQEEKNDGTIVGPREICLEHYRTGICPVGKPQCPYEHCSLDEEFCHQFLTTGMCHRQESRYGCAFEHALGMLSRHSVKKHCNINIVPSSRQTQPTPSSSSSSSVVGVVESQPAFPLADVESVASCCGITEEEAVKYLQEARGNVNIAKALVCDEI